MAIKDFINVSYLFENDQGFSINSINYFDILINPKIDIHYKKVTCNIQYQVLGKAISNTIKIDYITIDQNGFWKKDSNHNYKGKIEIADLPASYNGRNMQIAWWLLL